MEHLKEFQIPRESLEKLKDLHFLKNQIDEGKTFQEIVGYPIETMEKFYNAAYQLFQRQQYEESADAFVFLTTLNPRVHIYWLGLGMSEQQNEEFQSALIAYAMATLTDDSNPLPHYHSAACYHAILDPENAIASLQMAIKCAGDNPEHALIKNHSLSTLKALQKI